MTRDDDLEKLNSMYKTIIFDRDSTQRNHFDVLRNSIYFYFDSFNSQSVNHNDI